MMAKPDWYTIHKGDKFNSYFTISESKAKKATIRDMMEVEIFNATEIEVYPIHTKQPNATVINRSNGTNLWIAGNSILENYGEGCTIKIMESCNVYLFGHNNKVKISMYGDFHVTLKNYGENNSLDINGSEGDLEIWDYSKQNSLKREDSRNYKLIRRIKERKEANWFQRQIQNFKWDSDTWDIRAPRVDEVIAKWAAERGLQK